MSSKNFMINALNYTGRRYQLSRPSAVLARTNPDLKWCIICNQSVEKRLWGQHVSGVQHRLNTKKDTKLKDFALSLWEDHRGAPIGDESNIERAIRDGSVAETIARQNERSSEFATKIVNIERDRRAKLLSVEADGDDDVSGKNTTTRGDRQERFERNYQQYLAQSQSTLGSTSCGSRRGPTFENNMAGREGGSHTSRQRDDQIRVDAANSHQKAMGGLKIKEDKPLINHAALRRQAMLEGLEELGDDDDSSLDGPSRGRTSHIEKRMPMTTRHRSSSRRWKNEVV